MPSQEMLRKLLDEFVEKEALVNEELKVINEQIEELENRLEVCRARLGTIGADRERVIDIKARYSGGPFYERMTLVLNTVPSSTAQPASPQTAQVRPTIPSEPTKPEPKPVPKAEPPKAEPAKPATPKPENQISGRRSDISNPEPAKTPSEPPKPEPKTVSEPPKPEPKTIAEPPKPEPPKPVAEPPKPEPPKPIIEPSKPFSVTEPTSDPIMAALSPMMNTQSNQKPTNGGINALLGARKSEQEATMPPTAAALEPELTEAEIAEMTQEATPAPSADSDSSSNNDDEDESETVKSINDALRSLFR